MNSSRTAIHTNFRTSFFSGCESRSVNGTPKWKSHIKANPYSQPPWSRGRYQRISSGMLPAQIISHCEKLRYAHSMTKASISLPMSWKNLRFIRVAIGWYATRNRLNNTHKLNASRACPTTWISEYTVDGQPGIIDMNQSTVANVAV